MKVVLEFGIRGGLHTDNIVLPSAKLGARLARAIATVLMSEQCTTDFRLSAGVPRISLTSSAHFVSLTVLDGTPPGPAATALWNAQS